jgi:hypothetical protein
MLTKERVIKTEVRVYSFVYVSRDLHSLITTPNPYSFTSPLLDIGVSFMQAVVGPLEPSGSSSYGVGAQIQTHTAVDLLV